MCADIRELLKSISGGDTGALGELYELMSARVLNYARMISQNHELSEDVMHDVFLSIYAQAGRIADAPNPEGYIMVMTRNRTYNLLKYRRREETSLDDMRETSGGEMADGYLMFEDALESLPANQRETIYLRLICGYTYKETAKIQNAPLVTVKWRYGKAIDKLRDYFGEEESQNERV